MAHGALTDWRGLPVSSVDQTTSAAITRFEQAFHGFRDEAADILALAETTPEVITTQLYAAAMHLYSQTDAEIEAAARPLLTRAAALSARANGRERALLAALEAWSRSDLATAAAAFEDLLAQWPRDVTSAKFAEFVFFEAPDYPRHLRLMDAVAPANADLACFGAMHAFAHELNGHYDRATEIAQTALALDPDTPWADHALGHVYLNTGRIDAGRTALQAASHRWPGHSAGIRGHNAWHLALLHLATLDVESALGIYHSWFDGQDPTSAFEHTDAISLLWRIDLCGAPVPVSAWEPFVAVAEQRAGDTVMPFLNAHYLYALVRAGRVDAARAAVVGLTHAVDASRDPWRTGIALLAGTVSLAEGDAAAAAVALAPVRGRFPCVGGSDAQNDLFAQSLLVATARAGHGRRARALLAERVGDRRPTPQEESWLEAG